MEDNASINSGYPEPLQPESPGAGLIKGFLGTAKGVLLSPRLFFPNMPVEGGLSGPYVFFLLCTVFSFLVSLTLTLAQTKGLSLWAFIVLFAALWMPFVSAAILNLLFTKLLGRSGSYEATFRVICYASAVNLFAWIPDLFVILAFQFYEIYLSALGLSVVHRTSLRQALLVVVVTLLTVSVTITLVARVLFSS
jgi:hypothetical protein